MKIAQNPTIVIRDVCRCDSIHVVQVHHRDYPEIRIEAESLEAAVAQLINKLTRVLDSANDRWYRESIQSAIMDVKSFQNQPA